MNARFVPKDLIASEDGVRRSGTAPAAPDGQSAAPAEQEGPPARENRPQAGRTHSAPAQRAPAKVGPAAAPTRSRRGAEGVAYRRMTVEQRRAQLLTAALGLFA
ncbi:hypothetical protein QMK28_10770, partial [Streptomyces sp. H27-D2]|nr:hypothetical protein [Streptomyces sp. H27-D2]